jgi:Glyoxalase superfamily protein
MRFHFSTTDRAKALAKQLRRALGEEAKDASLGTAQALVARMFGYRDWQELVQVTGTQPPSPDDDECDAETIVNRRRQYVASLSAGGLAQSVAERIIDRLHPSCVRRGGSPGSPYDAQLRQLEALKSERAPWYKLVAPYLDGCNVADQAAAQFETPTERYQFTLGYRRKAAAVTGVGYDLLWRMARTLTQIELTFGIPRAESLLSDDYGAVEIAAKLASIDEKEGLRALLELKEGRVTKEEIEARYDGWRHDEKSADTAVRPSP